MAIQQKSIEKWNFTSGTIRISPGLTQQFNLDQGHSSPGNLFRLTSSPIGEVTKTYWINSARIRHQGADMALWHFKAAPIYGQVPSGND